MANKTSKDILDSILNESEKLALRSFWNNRDMREALRKVLFMGLRENGVMHKGEEFRPKLNIALALVAQRQDDISNEQLGADLRAFFQGMSALENAFNKIEEIATIPGKEDKGRERNPAL